MSINVVIVESPAKAKTINKYLGKDYKVMASYGHVRDLPSRDGSVLPDEDFRMTWDVDSKAAKHVKEIVAAVKNTEKLILATDPDREGEAISWHLVEVLRDKGVLDGVNVERVVFNAITKRAVLDAMKNPRRIDKELVDAYLARRALDYLVGFTLSPVLWRKLPGSRSAGRVQSVALRIICDRELQIEAFQSQEYWTVAAASQTANGEEFEARLVVMNGKKLEKFDLANESAAKTAVEAIKAHPFSVIDVERKPTKRNPPPPFITSTLQQEAARKLGFPVSRTMQIAQKLYEGIELGGDTAGLITYMRTDGVQMAPEAIEQTRQVIGAEFGGQYIPGAPRIYKSKVKNAQEAHEAIRPTSLDRLPKDMSHFLDRDQLKLYELIWRRAMASQMSSAELERTTIELGNSDNSVGLRATGSVITFDGFFKLYEEGKDDPASDEDSKILPKVNKGDAVSISDVTPDQHFTEPLPRFTEASLVKRMEELGIGRPSTYAQILSVLRDRKYVRMDKNRFIPEDKGRLVIAFLESFFLRYVEYDFTADLEKKLDAVSAGELNWKEFLRRFWGPFFESVDNISDLRISEVLDTLNESLGPHVFPAKEDGSDPRKCPSCEAGQLSLKTGRYGAFVGCSHYPDCKFTRTLTAGGDESSAANAGPVILGKDPESGLEVSLRDGRFGPYVQLGEAADGEKPKRGSIPRGIEPTSIDLARALVLLSLPREIGLHPETQKKIVAGVGRFGPYVLHDGVYASIRDPEELFTIGLNRAVTLLAEKKTRGGRSTSKALRELGEHPDEGGKVSVMDGRYGPYVKHGQTNASIPSSMEPDTITLEDAVELIAARAKNKPAKAKKKAAKKKKKPSKKSAAKKKTKKKTDVTDTPDAVE